MGIADMAPGISMLDRDAAARRDALDVERSFVVQAPAGSGKTQLLTQRLLALLSVVDRPEAVLAITFTVAATAEMRNRVIEELQKVQNLLQRGVPEADFSEDERRAAAVLAKSHRLGWSLLEQPQRLNIATIDALCLGIAYEAPLLSRLGGQLRPTTDAEPLYALAARRTLEQLGGSSRELSAAIEHLLRLRDVNLANCEKLIAGMLGKRDQWLEEFSLARSLSEQEWLELRARREAPLRGERREAMQHVQELLGRTAHSVTAMLELISHACTDSIWPASIVGLSGLKTLVECRNIEHLYCLSALMLTENKTWRKKPTAEIGFKTLKDGGDRDHVTRFKAIIAELSATAGLLEALCRLESLPNPSFTDDEWQTIRSIFTVLLHAAAELRVVFAERSRIDFVEAGITAEEALREPEIRRRWSERVQHLLVDEFQDTSRRQYTLLKKIVQAWDPHDVESGTRTCFLVGDPMQSIYLFRNAELALFDEVVEHGLPSDEPDGPRLRFTPLTLSLNFRSTAGIVEPINAMFHPFVQHGAAGAARFTPAQAKDDTPTANALHLHATFVEDPASPPALDEAAARQAEALEAAEIIRGHLPAMEQAKANGDEFRIGVLVRARNHLALIAETLRANHIPYRAVEIESLHERQEIRDLLSLMRALIHPMDRIAWLSVLRAPWCGLSLADLHILSGSDDKKLHGRPMRDMLDQRIALLSEDGQVRARRVQQVMELALSKRFAGPFAASPNGFATWIERTWIALGGPHCIDTSAAENVDAFFRLLAQFTPGGVEASGAELDARLEKLFAAPDSRAPEKWSVQLMTIHKAKGLGFNVVVVPSLEKKTGRNESQLLRWMVRTISGSADRELLIAPIGSKGGETSKTYTWIGKLQETQDREEIYRLLYVAATRARKELHLFAALKIKRTAAGSEIVTPKHTLLACGWGYLEQFAQQQLVEASSRTVLHLVPTREPLGIDIAAHSDVHTQQLRRLPSSYIWNAGNSSGVLQTAAQTTAPEAAEDPVRRRPGSLATRSRGTVLHALFESLASLPAEDARRLLPQSLPHWRAVATAMLRQAGLGGRELTDELKEILAMLQTAARDPDAQWILGRRPHARNETSWTTQEDGTLQTVRCDRVFLAGAEPLSEGDNYLWIVDYKTAEVGDSFLMDEKRIYEPQLLRYANALREATLSTLPVRLALYYPALPRLLWWEA